MLLSACATQANKRFCEIQDAAGQPLARITVSGEIEIDAPGNPLRSVTKRADKRKYYNQANIMQFAVKMDDDAFKLRDQNERLLWKIKLYPDKIKISNNEEMLEAWELKLKEEGRLKLEKNDAVITQIRLMDNAEKYTVNGYTLTGFGSSIARGVPLIAEIPDLHKALIMAELVMRER